MSYASEALKPRSGKVVLATLEAREVVKLFTLDTGSQYYKQVSHYVSGVVVNGQNLAMGVLPLSAGHFFFDSQSGRVYVRLSDGSDPKTKRVVINYKFFFSTSGHNLPFDLASGQHVHWEGRISGTGSIKQSLDDENTGVVVEAQSQVTLINADGYFDPIFDSLIWENREVSIWSWITSTPVSEAQKLFSGIILEKTYSPDSVSFKLRDFTFRLRDKLTLGEFSNADGTLSESDIGKPRRRVIGRVKQLQCTGVSKILGGYETPITISGAIDDEFITTSANYFGTIYQGDELEITLSNGESESIGADSLTNPTEIAVSGGLDTGFALAPIRVVTEFDKNFNRTWSICGHEIHQPSYEITYVVSGRRLELESVVGIYDGDVVEVNGSTVFVSRISGNLVTLSQSITPTPDVGDFLVRKAVQDVFVNGVRFIQDRDYTLSNSSEAKIVFDELAEFNVAKQKNLTGTNLTFTAAAQAVTSSNAELDLRTLLSPRDWVRSTSLTHTTWYEIAQVNQSDLILTTPFLGTTGATTAFYKNPEIINDDAIVTVSCYGLANSDGDWVKTAADATKYILENDAELTLINQAAFDKANAVCDYILSVIEPKSLGGGVVEIRTVLSDINQSVFGSLYTNSNFLLDYSILNSSRPETLEALKDDDILSFSVETKNQIASSIKLSYRPFTDAFTGEDTFEQITEASSFIQQTSEIEKQDEQITYLFEDDKAKIVAQRYLLFRSLPNSRVKVSAKLNLSNRSLNDKIYLELDRLYNRFGGRDRRKVGIISSIEKDGFLTNVEFNDLGGAFNRVGCIAPNAQSVHSLASRDDIARAAFIVDNTTETPSASSETDLGLNLIG